MALLRGLKLKIKASSLIEVLVAISIILIVFGITIMTIDNLLVTKTKHNKQVVLTRFTQLQYQYKHNSLRLPFEEQFGKWQILIYRNKKDKSVIFEVDLGKDNPNRIIKKTLCFEDKQANTSLYPR